MQYPLKRRCLSIAALSILLLASYTHADDHIEEVVVEGSSYLSTKKLTSSKTGTPLLDTPQSLSIFTAEDIANRSITSIGQIVDYTPGVNTSQGEGHRDAVVFRGNRSTADFYIDGARDDVQYYRSLYNLEQVEILRGPNALLFGRGGSGGIINRVTKKAEIGDNFTGYSVGLNSFGGSALTIDSNIDTGDSSAFRINAMYEHLENHRDFFDGDRIGINPTARFLLSPSTTLDVSYEYADHERFVDRGIPTGDDGEPVEALVNVVFADPENNFTELEAHVFRASLAHSFSVNSKFDFTLQYADYDKIYSNFFAAGFNQPANEVTIDGYIDSTDRQNLILSTNFINEFATGSVEHKLLVGGEYIDTSSDQDRFNSVFDTAPDPLDSDQEFFSVSRPLNLNNFTGVNAAGDITNVAFSDINDDTEVDIEVFSFFIQDEIALSKQLDLVLGARFDSFDIDVFDNDPDLVGDRNSSNRDEEISPRLGLIYKPAENVSIYLSQTESFLPRSGEQFADLPDDDESFEPETFETREIGLKWDFPAGLSLSAAYFENEAERADDNPAEPGTLIVIETEVEGFELQLQGNLLPNWNITANYSNLDGELADGNTPRELPENSLTIWNNIRINPAFGLGIGATYQDESFADTDNDDTLPSYVRFDAAAYYDVSDTMLLQLNIENLFDEEYFPNAHTDDQVTVGAPFNTTVTLSGRF